MDPELSNLTAVVVDEDRSFRSLVSQLLRRKGAKVFTVSNIRDGTETFIREQPDFVFVDLHLPHGDSFELLARIRTLDAETSRKTPVIAMNSLSDTLANRYAVTSGFYSILGKPFVLPQLLETIAKALQSNEKLNRVSQCAARSVYERTNSQTGRESFFERSSLIAGGSRADEPQASPPRNIEDLRKPAQNS
jgi:DNA-binding NtrC family response regulator